MADKKEENCISPAAADALIAAHDGDTALLALYLARHPGADDETAAAVLCRTRAEIANAREKLGRILRAEKPERTDKPFYPTDEPVEYPVKDIVRTFEGDNAFQPIMDELTRILGTTPSRAYLNTLVDIYDHLGMPPEVIMVLLNYCSDEIRRRFGSERRPSARQISEEAYAWANREILTLEQADEYIAASAKRREDKSRIAALMGIRGRELSRTESKYLESWIEMGFDDEAIAAAFDRTLTNTGALKWPYLNGILKNWHAKGLHDAAAIEAAEGRRREQGRGNGTPGEVDPDELERIRRKVSGEKI